MNNLITLIGRRLIALPLMVLGVTFLVFVIMSLSPVDPAYVAFGENNRVADKVLRHFPLTSASPSSASSWRSSSHSRSVCSRPSTATEFPTRSSASSR